MAHGLKAMRRILFVLTILGVVTSRGAETAPRPATADELALFKDALKNGEQDEDHWAYTETVIVRDSKGLLKDETVMRYDPSKPYEEQYTPLKIDGKEPTKRQLRKYREKGVARGKAVARRAQAADKGKKKDSDKDNTVRLDLEHPLVREAGAGRILYEIPLAGQKSPVPVDKVQVLVEVDPRSRRLTQGRLLVLEAFRVKAIAKVKRGVMRADFTVIDPAFPSVVTHMEGNVGASVLLIPLNATITGDRKEVQRVKAFDERFSVKLAPLQMLGF